MLRILLFTQICKDKYEAEIWFVALRALISQGNCQKWRTEIRIDDALSDSSSDRTERNSLSVLSFSSSDAIHEVAYCPTHRALKIFYNI